jgi:2-succinyl-5-enolpyruvyl-6-hydroxy-3-cyclohexene-1-carboxylate synthase
VNVELSVPLVPADGAVEAPAPGTAVRAEASAAASPVTLPGSPRTLVICGDATVATGLTARRLAESAGLPLLAEPSSNARCGANALATGRLLLSGPLGGRIERVVVFGRPTLSRPVTMLLSRPDVELVVVADGLDYVDPGWRASLLAEAVAVAPGPAEWLADWQSADAMAAQRVAEVTGPDALAGPELARLVLASVPSDGVLVLGNSNPIRDADLAPVRDDAPRVFANRGLAGIDGTIATASGIALATGAPTTLLCGDLTFCHDAGSLAIGPGEPRPDLRIVVADDRGGSIFATLEYGQGRFADGFERVFATPTGVDPSALATGYGIPSRRLTGAAEVERALAAPFSGVEVLVVDVDRTDRARMEERLARG